MKNINILLLSLISTFSSLDVNSEIFKEASTELGIEFKHQDGRSGNYHFTETLGSGLVWLDYNNDKKIDLLLINGHNDKHKLYENNGSKFLQTTKLLNLNGSDSRGMGVCSADLNQDGWIDFLITHYGDDVLYINQAGQGFKTKTISVENKDNQWSTSCAFADLDSDGDLDLYVARYVVYNLNGNNSCSSGDVKGYCNPTAYPGAEDGLYLNDGFGEFKQVKKRGIHSGTQDRALGVIISDLDHDNDMDIYVANDGSSNRLYLNDGKGFFADHGLLSGTAINFNGVAEASMGIALGDVNNDLYQDIILSHFALETNTVYINGNDAFFSDMTQNLGLTQSSLLSMGWGIILTDINNNGYNDLLVANGHFHDFAAEIDNRQSYNQDNHVFINQSGNKLELLALDKSFHPKQRKSSRGMAAGDWNNDGLIDLGVNNINHTVDVYQNSTNNKNNWIGIKLTGNKINRSAIGAVVTVKSGDNSQRKELFSGGSFMSQSDLRLIYGLANYSGLIEVQVKWPDGKITQLTRKNINQYYTINY